MVQTSLINMYFKCREVDYAEKMFYYCGCSMENIVTWNVMVDGYASNDQFMKSIACMRRMQDEYKLTPDKISMIIVLPACAQLGELLLGKSIHGHVLRKGVVPDVVLETALINMYGECRKVNNSETIFSQMAEKNLVTWNSMAAALVRNGREKDALTFFLELWHEQLALDEMTIAMILPAYAEVAQLREGTQIHSFIVKSGLSSNTFVLNSLVFMYEKCGDLDTAREIFDWIMFKDVITWNVIIMAYAIHGQERKSF
ncbi:hypothetical protein MLD38_006594 [Melastoma candidum]|uniref:Uncharacterized protein n=1 Tax=Melastoma candidum TaxID=119954 RepID=A0ACB9RN21_9MYRT|nr:hypothetical protein MLD38_006594 [Melastoma candidum]